MAEMENLTEELNDEMENLEDIQSTDVVPSKKKKWYKKWYMILIYVIFSLAAVLGFTLGMFVIFAEYGQCNRSCRLEFCQANDSLCFISNDITGKRKKINKRDKCLCSAPKLFSGTREVNRMSPATDTWALDAQIVEYCAIPPDLNYTGDAKTYPSKEAAEADYAILLHAGACGQCSSINDHEVYNETRFTLTKTSTKGAFFSIFSRKAAKNVMLDTGMTDGCSECWVENMRHTLIHCFGRCMFGDRSSCTKDGELTDCLLCDEVHSGVFFRNCAGMTRRRAGIVTDICRKPSEIK